MKRFMLPFLLVGALAYGQSFPVKTNASGTITEPSNIVVTGAQGGTNVANTGKSITLGGNLTTTGAFNITINATANSTVTIPTTGVVLNEAAIAAAYQPLNATLTGLAGKATTGTGNIVLATGGTLSGVTLTGNTTTGNIVANSLHTAARRVEVQIPHAVSTEDYFRVSSNSTTRYGGEFGYGLTAGGSPQLRINRVHADTVTPWLTVATADGAGTIAGNLSLTGTSALSIAADGVGLSVGTTRPFTYNGNGSATIRGDAGTWSLRYGFAGNAGTLRGGFGALGSADALTYLWMGTAHDSYFARVESGLFALSGALNASKSFRLRTGLTDRWTIGSGDDVEAGANTGSSFVISRFTDGGVAIDSPVEINRATGAVTIRNAVSMPGNLAVSGTGATTLGGTGATVAIAGTSAVRGIRTATASIDFASMAAGAGNTQTMTITGVAVGDAVNISTGDGSAHPDEITVYGFVSAANTVSLRAVNRSAGTYDPAAKVYRATVTSF